MTIKTEQTTLNNPQIVASVVPVSEVEQINHQISSVAKRSLLELGIGCVCAGITSIFVTTGIGIAILFASVVATVLFNTILRSVPIYLQMELFQLKNTQGLSEKDKQRISILEDRLKMSKIVVEIFCPIVYTQIDTTTRSLLTHEAGHALAALAFYKNANPKISIYPGSIWTPFWTFTGDTSWNGSNSSLTTLGKLVGRNAANLICVAAGTGLAIISSISGLIIARKCEESHPELSRYCLVSSISTIAQHILYALSVFWESHPRSIHDFMQLWAGGIHPVLAAFTISLPLIVRGCLFLSDQPLSFNHQIHLDI